MNKQHSQLLERLEDSAAQVADAVKKLSPEELNWIPKEGDRFGKVTLGSLLQFNAETGMHVFRVREYPEVVIKQLRDYRAGKLSSSIMEAIAKSLSDRDVEDLAA